MKHILHPSNKTLDLVFAGDLLSTNADQFRTEFVALLETEPLKSLKLAELRLDLTAASMIDSVGLNLVVGFYKEAKKRGAKTVALIRSKNIQRTFLFTRLDAHLDIEMVA